ncbi:WYL domain-containing protein [Ruminococcus sp. AF18-29]|jgi:predicted DNA-binding transcriptional regulator YafY|nr:WYL domain-containing protein [Ruminococcus sp. AF18-29]
MNAKCRLLCLREMFIKYTDQNNYVSMERIQNYLTSCGYPAHKVTIKDDIDALISSGMEIEYIHNKGYHLRSRPFSLSILKILADAIASFRFLTVDDSEKLLKLLESLCSIYEAPMLRRKIMLTNRVKSDNEQILDNIDVINSAFRNNQQISFDYYDYDINKHLVQRGEKRLCSPFALVMSGECYYVVSYYEKYADTYTNFRLDRMRNIRLVNSAREYLDEKLNLEQYIKSSFSMFSGKSEYVTLRLPLENKYCNIVIDRFGKSVLMLKDKQSDKHFIIHVLIKSEYPQPFFSWIFSFSGEVEILSPVRLKERYTETLMKSCILQYAH